MPKCNTNDDVRRELLEAYDMLKADPKRLNQVSELANTMGKVIASAKLEVEYHFYKSKFKDFPNIPFMEKGR